MAKTEKPVLLIYGSTLEAYVAALQAANSGVSTLWVDEYSSWIKDLDVDVSLYTREMKLNGGVWQILTGANAHNAGDVIEKEASRLDKILEDKNSLLQIVNGARVTKIEKKTKSWKVFLANRSSYEVKVVLDASESQFLKQLAGIQAIGNNSFNLSRDLSLASSRSIIFAGEIDRQVRVMRLQDVVSQEDNFFSLGTQSLDFLPNRIAYGQTMGAIVGYCAFFKTSLDKIDLRTLQQELLLWKSRLLPAVDISFHDKYFRSIERIFLSGILPLKLNEENEWIFSPQDSVKVEEIKPILTQMYSRTQLWFADNEKVYLNLQDLLNLIKFAAFRGEELDIEVQKTWKKELAFDGDYDPNKIITRYEFAVLFDRYASPFIKKVSQNGEVIYR